MRFWYLVTMIEKQVIGGMKMRNKTVRGYKSGEGGCSMS